jgi:hypothetical protein
MLKSGLLTNTFFCPSTAPKFNDQINWAGPGPTLWGFSTVFHIVGYAFAFSNPHLDPTNQNTTLVGESVNGMYFGPSDRVLVADVAISANNTTPGYANPGNNYTDVGGGFYLHHLSAHLDGTSVPVGQFLGFKDGHVEWHLFLDASPRSSAPYFWW